MNGNNFVYLTVSGWRPRQTEQLLSELSRMENPGLP